jgi:hypothetical protein
MKNIIKLVIFFLTLSLTFIDCGNGTTGRSQGTTSNPKVDNKTDPALNGIWVSDYQGIKDYGEFNFDNGTFIHSVIDSRFTPFTKIKGTYTTSTGKITLTLTNVFYYPENKWYSKEEFGIFLRKEDPSLSDEFIAAFLNEMFTTDTSSYSINGNKLTIVNSVYTKK